MMNRNEKHSWAHPTAEGLAHGLGVRGLLNEEARDGVVAGAIRSFTEAIKKKVGPLAGSSFAMDVAESKGDLSKVPGSKELGEAINQLAAIEQRAGAGSLGRPFAVAREARDLLTKNKQVFQNSFKSQTSTGRYVYIGAVIALYSTVSLILAECVDFQPAHDGSYEPVVIKPAVDNVAGSIPASRLERFVSRASKATFEGSLNEHAPLLEYELANTISSVIGSARSTASGYSGVIPTLLVGAAAIAFLLWFARDVVEWFFSVRKRFSTWLELQARFLELNSMRLQGGRSATARAKQQEYAAAFRRVADSVKIENADGTRQAAAEIQDQDQEIARASTGGSSFGALV